MKRARGFTLVELMIVMAIIVILSVIAVMTYKRFMARARATEVHAMFSEIRAKEESYRAEFGTYLTISTGETDFYPALGAAGTEPLAKAWQPTNAAWTQLGIRPPSTQVYCGYAVIAGAANNWGAAGTQMKAFMKNPLLNNGTNPPAVNWWCAVAMCDNDSSGGALGAGVNAEFFTSSQLTTVREGNPTR